MKYLILIIEYYTCPHNDWMQGPSTSDSVQQIPQYSYPSTEHYKQLRHVFSLIYPEQKCVHFNYFTHDIFDLF